MTKDYDCGYTDNGCELQPTCLNCDLPICKHDLQEGFSMSKIIRDAEIVKLYGEGYGKDQIATKFNLGSRTVRRAINGGR